VIDVIERGQVPDQAGIAQAQAAYGPLVTRVIQAAYGAFHAGLNVALVVSGLALVGSGIVAWTTLGSARRTSFAPDLRPDPVD